MRFKLLCLLLPYALSADPWGKDADLVRSSCRAPCVSVEHPGIAISTTLIRFHQEVISPIDGPRSHFLPSSSQYTLEAIQKYGFLEGFTRGCDRLLRENEDPWIYPLITDPNGNTFKLDRVR